MVRTGRAGWRAALRDGLRSGAVHRHWQRQECPGRSAGLTAYRARGWAEAAVAGGWVRR